MEVRPGYKQTEVGVIPQDWNAGCIGDSFDVCNQLRLPLSQSIRVRMSGPYPYYGPTSVQGWINEYRVHGEYALIGEDGDHFLKWQSQSMTLLVRGKFNVNNHAHLVRGTKNLTEWFYWFFANRDLTPYLTRQGAGRYKLTKAALVQVPVALPLPSEQRAIATALTDVDELVGALDRLIAKKRDLKHAAMQQLLTGQTRLPGFTSEWEETSLGTVASLYQPQTISAKQFTDSGFPVYGANGVVGYYHSTNHSDWQVTVTCRGSTCGTVSKTVERCWITGNAMVLNCDHNKKLDKDFFYYLMLAQDFSACITGTGQPQIVRGPLAEFVLELPSDIPEQRAIAAVLTDIDAELAVLEQRLSKTRNIKQAMMQELSAKPSSAINSPIPDCFRKCPGCWMTSSNRACRYHSL